MLLAIAKPDLAALLLDKEEPTVIVVDTHMNAYLEEVVQQV